MASDGPPEKRSDTQSPFALLSPNPARQRAGMRVTISEADEGELAVNATAPVTPSVPPESLRKPFASLTPKKLTPTVDSKETHQTPAAAPAPPSQLFATTASMRPGSGPQPLRASTSPRRADPSTAAKYGSCNLHGTARNSDGKCVLCVREETKRKAARSQRVVFFVGVALLLAALAAAYLALPR